MLLPLWNSGPSSDKIVGRYRQPLSRGLISLVFLLEQPLCESGVHRNPGQDRTLDGELGVRTGAMIAVPVRRDGVAIGVVSCVKLLSCTGDAPDPEPFSEADLQVVMAAVESLPSEGISDR
jgi:hypothetical protein